jgi:hypothetical protein
MTRGLTALAIAAITALSFSVFPGHTYLEQDTQIYVPILEHQWSGALAHDLVVQHPHVSFTLYDELANLLRGTTRLPLEYVLEGEQLVFRACGFLGIYLIASSFGLGSEEALLVTALWALGATIKAPAVLTIEYEPTPRAFAVPLLLLAVGLALRQKYRMAGWAATCAVLLHAPTTWPYLAVAGVFVLLRPRAWSLVVYPLIALVLLAVIGFMEPSAERQSFFGSIGPAQEALQRMRVSYSYVSTWWRDWAGQYEFFAAVAVAALWRVRSSRDHWIWIGGLLVTGIVSVPLSWLLLEQLHLSIGPQVQPARALLFVTAMAVAMAAIAGVKAKRRVEAAIWFLFCLLVPVHAAFFEWPGWRVAFVVAACCMVLAALPPRWRTGTALLIAPLIAYGAGVTLYTHTETPDLRNLAQWARVKAKGVYLFPEAGRDHVPGWFRATSLQPVYVDWKGGGQVNYLPVFSEQWATRWQQVTASPTTPENFGYLPVDYLVYPQPLKTSLPLAFHNSSWWVYDLHVNGSSR